MINLGCTHVKFAYNHCGEMLCRNYVNKCPRHSLTGSTTAVCNLERAKSLMSLSDETRETVDGAIGLNPAMEDVILLIVDLAFRDGADSVESF